MALKLENVKMGILAFIAIMGIPLFLVYVLQGIRKRESLFKDNLWDKLPPEERERRIDQHILQIGDQREKREAKQEAKSAPRPQAQQPAGSNPGPQPKLRFQSPNFNGPPHAVLGLPAQHSKEDVQAAYKHWIKRYHPDHVNHLGVRFIEQAQKRTLQLNAAKDALLQRFSS